MDHNIDNPALSEPFKVGRDESRLLFDVGIAFSCIKKNSTDNKVLDFASGTGWISEWLNRMGFDVVACDIFENFASIFLSEEILPFQSASETVDEIHDQGGLVILPHPFDQFRKKRLADLPRESLIDRIDIIEGYNSRNISKRSNENAIAYAQQFNKPVSVGSDAHTAFEIGNAWTEMEVFGDPKEFLRNLEYAAYFHKPSGYWVHAITKMVRLVRS